jgi:uncharacterized phage protein (TIGR02218 family)
MKNANAALIGLFSTDQHFEQFDLYTFTLRSGLVLRYANCAFDVVVGANTFLCARSSGGVVIDEDQDQDSGPRAHWTNGFDTGTWEVTIMPRTGDLIGNKAWTTAVRAGLLDEASVRVDRGYINAWPTTLALIPIGTINVFVGRVAEIDFGRSAVIINMNDPRELLDTQMPRNLYSASCRYALFDSGCTLVRASFATAAAVTGSVDDQTLNLTANQADAYFSLGEIEFTSGANNGLRNMVRSWAQAGGVAELLTPMPFAVSNGDSVNLYPGCDKLPTTCDGKFANLLNFGGEPYIPAAETAL